MPKSCSPTGGLRPLCVRRTQDETARTALAQGARLHASRWRAACGPRPARHAAAHHRGNAHPLKIIACDYERMEEAVLTQGPLARAVGASIAIPGLISAPVIDGRLHVDGGVVNPVPFDHVRDGVDLVVAVDVTGKPRQAAHGRPGNMEVAVGSLLIMFNRMAQLKRALAPPTSTSRPDRRLRRRRLLQRARHHRGGGTCQGRTEAQTRAHAAGGNDRTRAHHAGEA